MKEAWTDAEIKILIDYYPSDGTNITVKLPNRTVNAIKNKAQQLGILTRKPITSWTAEEIEILKQYYPIEGKHVVSRLPGRTISTIQVYAFRLGIKKVKPLW